MLLDSMYIEHEAGIAIGNEQLGVSWSPVFIIGISEGRAASI